MRQRIIKILSDLRPEFDFSQDINFIEQGMLDSFDVFNLTVSLEQEFKIKIDGMDIIAKNFTGIDKIIKLLNKYGAK
jgi:acyl carrier protein